MPATPTSLHILHEAKRALRNGPYAWPGGYPLYFVTHDSAALSFAAVRAEWRQIVHAHLTNNKNSDWFIAGVDINYEDPFLHCEHTGERIPSAYAES